MSCFASMRDFVEFAMMAYLASVFLLCALGLFGVGAFGIVQLWKLWRRTV